MIQVLWITDKGVLTDCTVEPLHANTCDISNQADIVLNLFWVCVLKKMFH